MLLENDIHYLDDMIEAYAYVTSYVDRVPELEDKISAAYKQVCGQEAEFDSFNAILGRGYPHHEQWVRHVAWISQHVFGNRAFCVGNKLLLSRGGSCTSPLVDQLAILGYLPYTQEFPPAAWAESIALTQIDSMVVDRPSNRVFLVKGQVYESAIKNANFRPKDPLLFGQHAIERDSFFVKPRKIACLSRAFGILRTAFPKLIVVPVVLVVDDVGMGWGYRAFDVSRAVVESDPTDWKCLQDYPAIATSGNRAGDVDALRYLPDWAKSDPLRSLPVDRATRCLIILNQLWNKQREVGSRLAVIAAKDLAHAVRQRYLIEYPNDLRRHDIEDCLERGGLIERPAFEGNAYALTAKGAARVLLAKRLFGGIAEFEDDDDVTSHLLAHVHKQAVRWASYRAGKLVCA